jgi:hypothetical protein
MLNCAKPNVVQYLQTSYGSLGGAKQKNIKLQKGNMRQRLKQKGLLFVLLGQGFCAFFGGWGGHRPDQEIIVNFLGT